MATAEFCRVKMSKDDATQASGLALRGAGVRTESGWHQPPREWLLHVRRFCTSFTSFIEKHQLVNVRMRKCVKAF